MSAPAPPVARWFLLPRRMFDTLRIVDGLPDVLDHVRHVEQLTYRELSEAVDLPTATVHRFINRVGEPELATVRQVLRFLADRSG